MEHKKLSVILLLAGGIAGLGGAAVFFGYAPAIGLEIKAGTPELARLFWPLLALVWVIALLYAAALWQYMAICVRIGKNNSFCAGNAASLRRIGLFLYAAAGVWGLLILSPLVLKFDIGPVWLVFMLVGLASAAVGMVARAMAALVARAAKLQEENDLTV